MGLGCQGHAPAALPPGKTRYPLYRRLGGPQDRSGRVRKISSPLRFDPRTVLFCLFQLYGRAKRVTTLLAVHNVLTVPYCQ